MADDSIKVYDWALQKNKEILISGYYGFKTAVMTHFAGDYKMI